MYMRKGDIVLTLQNAKDLLQRLETYINPSPTGYNMQEDQPYAILMTAQGYEIGEEAWLSYDDNDNIVFTVDAPEMEDDDERIKWEFLVQENNITHFAWRDSDYQEHLIAKGERALITLESILKNCIVKNRYRINPNPQEISVFELLHNFLNEDKNAP